jgi:tetratricopeptide (TPR) repeat protein
MSSQALQLVFAKNLIRQGRIGSALQLLQKIVAADGNLPEAYHVLAQAFSAQNKMGEALKSAERAHQLNPANTDYAMSLGRLYSNLKLYEYAFPLLQKAFERNPEAFDTNECLARYYLEIERGHQALAYFQRAVTAAPDAIRRDETRLKLVECLSAINETERATKLLEELAEDSDSTCQDSAKLMRGLGCTKPVDRRIITDIEEILQRPNLGKELKSQCLLALGRCCDLEGSHDVAFDFWRQSRDLLGVKVHSKSALTVRNMQTRGIYSRAILDAAVPYGHQRNNLIFIAGMPRSGTTLTAQILAAHPQVSSIGETDRMNTLDIAFRRGYWHQAPEAGMLENAKKGELRALAQETIRFFDAITDADRPWIVEKSPTNYESLGYIHLCFPQARFIHCKRHPADNFISAYQLNMNRTHDYSYDQVAFAERYLAQESIMNYWKRCFPSQILEVSYEELVSSPEDVIRRIVGFCGLEWSDDCLNFHQKKSTVRTYSTNQVRQPIFSTSVGRWKLYEKHLQALLTTLKLQ